MPQRDEYPRSLTVRDLWDNPVAVATGSIQILSMQICIQINLMQTNLIQTSDRQLIRHDD